MADRVSADAERGAESRDSGRGRIAQTRTGTSNRGFASMDRTRQREIASKGGRAAHQKGTAHEWTADEARVAGRKGGETVSRDREHMAAIGREGGGARSASARQRASAQRNEAVVEDRSRISRAQRGDEAEAGGPTAG
jgi:general stress protein YciG